MYAGNSGKEHYIPGHLIANEIGPTSCESLLCKGCDTTYSVNIKGKRPTLNWLHIIIDMLSKTFHECKIDDSVDSACSYALLSYGKKGRYMSMHSMSCATPTP